MKIGKVVRFVLDALETAASIVIVVAGVFSVLFVAYCWFTGNY